jgi:predicted kinase
VTGVHDGDVPVPDLSFDTRAVVSDDEIVAGVVCMMCGVAGSGKTTWAKQLEARGLTRLSIDEAIWQQFGQYGRDYDPVQYDEHQAAVRVQLDAELDELLCAGAPCVLDYSFWQRTERESYKSKIISYNRPWKLLVLRVPPAVLRQRLRGRNERRDANAAFPIHEDQLDSYLRGFEWPSGEGETLLPV